MRKIYVDKRKTKDIEVKYVKDPMPKRLVHTDEFLCESEQVVDGRPLKVLDRKKVDPRDNFKNFTVNDFCMENVLAAGAQDSLRTLQFTDQDVDKILNQIEK